MKTGYIEFTLVLGNGEKCRVRYSDRWGSAISGNRARHFEFLDCLSVSETGYKSEFVIVEENEKIDPETRAKEIIERLTGIRFDGVNVQQKLF